MMRCFMLLSCIVVMQIVRKGEALVATGTASTSTDHFVIAGTDEITVALQYDFVRLHVFECPIQQLLVS